VPKVKRPRQMPDRLLDGWTVDGTRLDGTRWTVYGGRYTGEGGRYTRAGQTHENLSYRAAERRNVCRKLAKIKLEVQRTGTLDDRFGALHLR
jgi:hypothetical protein